MPCEWNYRPDHCMYLSVCKTAERGGVFVLHGNRGALHANKEPAFVAVYNAFCKVCANHISVYGFHRISEVIPFFWMQYELGNNLESSLLTPMKLDLMASKNTNCGKLYRSLVKSLQAFVYSQPHRWTNQTHVHEFWHRKHLFMHNVI